MSTSDNSRAAFIVFYGFDRNIIDPQSGKDGLFQAVVIKRTSQTSSGHTQYSAVGGFAEGDETDEMAARRECQEELVGLIDLSNNKLDRLPSYTTERGNVDVQPFACELTEEQLRKLQHHIKKATAGNPSFQTGYAEKFTADTDNEVAEVLLMSFKDADRLDFYEPHARDDYRIVASMLSKSMATDFQSHVNITKTVDSKRVQNRH